jgi:hypothetical protein
VDDHLTVETCRECVKFNQTHVFVLCVMFVHHASCSYVRYFIRLLNCLPNSVAVP